jgi:hypothetical protein
VTAIATGDTKTMRVRWVRYILSALLPFGLSASGALGSVSLVLVESADSVPVGRYVDVDLYAVSDVGTEFVAMDVVLTWDSTALEMVDVIDSGPHEWDFLFGFVPDGELDGLNDSLLDGDALFQALSFSRATATADGLLVATFRFSAIAESPLAECSIDEGLDLFSPTRVYAWGGSLVTGSLSSASVEVASLASLSAYELVVAAGREADLIISGEIEGADTIGVTIAVELVPRPQSEGVVAFTPAPPVDIELLGDPWPDVGTFSPYDTDVTSSASLNGSVLDDGIYVPGPVFYSGVLVSFPVRAAGDASGVWDVRLCTGGCTAEDAISTWSSVPTAVATALYHNVVRVVALGDGDGSDTIDARDFSEFQACFTSDVGVVDPPAYSTEPGQRCGVYDFDDDGDVDTNDFAVFRDVMRGPAP